MTDVVLSTAHKAKGLEFDTVQLTDDFMCPDGGMMMLFSGGLKPNLEFNPCTVISGISGQQELCNLLYTGWRRKNVPNIRKRYAQSY